jgi:ubiquinone/menaquinone biosynthesis C-methylase UbiE
LSRGRPGANAAVLEIACGPGIVTRKLRDALPATAQLVATDLNEPVLELRARGSAQNEAVEWQQADAMNLPFAGVEKPKRAPSSSGLQPVV